MKISVSSGNDSANFILEGEIDEVGAQTIKTKYHELNNNSLKNLTFDFKNVTHIGSAGIGKLLLFYKDVATKGGDIFILNPSKMINDLFVQLRLNTIFKIQN
ncbi:MAG: anti-sigma-factor antagonist [uncultured bacterium]|nr:MAG: anti-sigma-factor antagonist [uncultured bacterium]